MATAIAVPTDPLHHLPAVHNPNAKLIIVTHSQQQNMNQQHSLQPLPQKVLNTSPDLKASQPSVSSLHTEEEQLNGSKPNNSAMYSTTDAIPVTHEVSLSSAPSSTNMSTQLTKNDPLSQNATNLPPGIITEKSDHEVPNGQHEMTQTTPLLPGQQHIEGDGVEGQIKETQQQLQQQQQQQQLLQQQQQHPEGVVTDENGQEYDEEEYEDEEDYEDDDYSSEDESPRENRVLTFADEHGHPLCHVLFYDPNPNYISRVEQPSGGGWEGANSSSSDADKKKQRNKQQQQPVNSCGQCVIL